jgi:hypothetical protein
MFATGPGARPSSIDEPPPGAQRSRPGDGPPIHAVAEVADFIDDEDGRVRVGRERPAEPSAAEGGGEGIDRVPRR